jgi:nitroreductase
MNPINRNQLLDQLNWRYATKQFDSTRKISAEDWDSLEEALRLSPSSVGLQPWKFLVITDPALRAELQPFSYGQSQIVDASHLVVLTTKVNLGEADVDAHVAKVAEVRGVPAEDLAPLKAMAMGGIVSGKSETERRDWAFNQTYLALGNLLTSAALLGTLAPWKDSPATNTIASSAFPNRAWVPRWWPHSVIAPATTNTAPRQKSASIAMK